MADATLNTVLAGSYENARISISSSSQVAYIEGSGFQMYITKNNVVSVSPVSESTASTVSVGGAALGTLAFGTGGAALGKGTNSQYLLEIKWRAGGTSLIKVDRNVNEAITVGMYKNISQEEEQKIKSKDKSTETMVLTITVVIFFAYALYYLFNS